MVISCNLPVYLARSCGWMWRSDMFDVTVFNLNFRIKPEGHRQSWVMLLKKTAFSLPLLTKVFRWLFSWLHLLYFCYHFMVHKDYQCLNPPFPEFCSEYGSQWLLGCLCAQTAKPIEKPLLLPPLSLNSSCSVSNTAMRKGLVLSRMLRFCPGQS